MKSSRYLARACLLACALFSASLHAQTTYYWDHNGFGSGYGGTGTWNTSLYTWNNSGDPFVTWSNSGQTDHAVFQQTAGIVTLGSDITVRSINFVTDGYSVAGSNTLTFDGGTGIINSYTGSQTISAPIAGDDGLTKTGVGSLTLSGANTYTGTTDVSTGTLTLASNTALGSTANGTSVASGATLAFTNNINIGAEAIANSGLVENVSGTNSYSGVLSGTGALTVTAGQLTLSGANTYTGGTTISAGTLSLTSTTASPTFDIASGATLELSTGSATNTTYSGSGTLATNGSVFWGGSAATFALGSGSLIDVQSGVFIGGSSANEVWTSNLSDLNVASGATFDTVEANVRVNALTGSGTIKTGHPHAGYANLTIGVDNGSGIFTGVLADSATTGNVVKTGTGTQTLSGPNTYSGSTHIAAGTLQIASGGSLSHPSSLLYVGRNSGENGALTIDAGGTVSSGRAEIGQNSGSIGAASISGTWNASDLYVARVGNGTLNIGNNGIVNVDSGSNRTNLASNPGSVGTLNITGSTAAGVLNSDFVFGGSGTATLNFNHSDSDYHFTSTGASGGNAVPIIGSTTVNHLGSGQTTLSGASTYAAATTINAGTLNIANAGSITHTGHDTYVGYDSGDNGTLSIASGGLVSDRFGVIGANAGSTGTADISGTWTHAHAFGLYVGSGGSGTLNLNNGGIVNVNGGSGTTTIASAAGSTGTLNLNGSTAVGILNTATIRAGAGSATLNFNHTAADYHFNKTGASGGAAIAITGTTAVGHTGTGTTTLSDAFTYTGGTTASQGNLNISSTGSITHNSANTYVGRNAGDNGALNIAAGGSVSNFRGIIGDDTGSTGTATVSGTWNNSSILHIGSSGTGTLNIADSGTVNVGSNGNGEMRLGVNAGSIGTLNITGNSEVGVLNASGVGSGLGSATLNFNHSNLDYSFTKNGYYEGARIAITGTTAVNHLGTGETFLTASNTYTGDTTVSHGTLSIGPTGSLVNQNGYVYVGKSSGDNATFNIYPGASVSTKYARLANDAGSAGIANINGTWNSEDLQVGVGGTGTLNIAATGTVTSSGALNLGYDSTGTGTANVSGLLETGPYTNIGREGTGTVNLENGGTFKVNFYPLILSYHSGSSGTLNIKGSTSAGVLDANNVQGFHGAATLNFNHSDSDYYFTRTGEFNGTPVLITGSTTINHIGSGNTGLLTSNTHTGGTNISAGRLALLHATDTLPDTGAVTLTGGILDISSRSDTIGALTLIDGSISGTTGVLSPSSIGVQSGSISAKLHGSASLTKTGSGTTTLSGTNTYTGDTTISDGTLTFSSTGSLSNADAYLYVGKSSGDNGTLSIAHGGSVSTKYALLANDAGSVGNADISGTWNSEFLHVGTNGLGTLTIAPTGIVSATSGVYIGSSSPGTGTANVSGLLQAGSFGVKVGRSGTGTLNLQNGGTVKVNSGNSALTVGEFAGSTGTLNLNGSTTPGVVNATSVHGGLGTATLNFNHTAADYHFTKTGAAGGTAVAITGSTAVNHLGTGTTTLSGANTYTSGTTISSGTLAFSSSGSLSNVYSFYVGKSSGDNGTLTIAHGGSVSTRYALLANDVGSVGEANISGTWNSEGLHVGLRGTGTLNVAATGIASSNRKIYVGNFSTATGTANVTGLMQAGSDVIVGSSGIGTLNLQNGGTVKVNSGNSSLIVGELVGSTGIVNINGSSTPGVVDAASVHGGLGTATLNFNHTNTDSGHGHHFTTDGTSGGTAIAITGSTAVNLLGAGTTSLRGANTYTGGTTISAGRLVGDTTSLQGNITNNASLVIDQSTNGTFAGSLSGSGRLSTFGSGTVTLSGTNSYTGETSIAGTLAIASTGSLVGNTSLIRVGSSGSSQDTFSIASGGHASTSGGRLGSTTGSHGTADISGTWTNTGDLEVGTYGTGILNIHSGGIVNDTVGYLGSGSNSQGTANISGTWNNSSYLVVGSSGDGELNIHNGGIVNANSGSALTALGTGGTTGTLNILGSSAAGVLNTGQLFASNANSTATLNFNHTDSSHHFTSNGASDGTAVDITGHIAINHLGTGTTILTGANTYSGGTTVSAGTLQGNTTSLQGNITNNANLAFDQSTAGTYSDVISGSGSVTKLGASSLTLSTTQVYSGGTTISAGTLTLGHASDTLLDAGAVSINGGTLAIGTNSETIGALTLTSGSITGSTGVLSASAMNVQSGSVSAILGGSAALSKTTAGTVILTGANTYSGGTTITAGNLQGTTTSLQGNITNNGALTFDQNNHATFSNVISGSGSVTKLGTGTFTLSGANTYSGATNIGTGTIAVSGNSALGTGTLNLNGAELQATGGAASLSNAVSLNADTTIAGSNNLTLTGAVTLNGFDSLNITNSGQTTLSGNIGQSSHSVLIKEGNGELELTEANTYTGGTSIAAGTVRINNAEGSAFGTGAVTIASGATLTGGGSFSGALQLNGTFSPGNSPGTLNSGSTTFGPDGNFIWEINDADGSVGTNYDFHNITGALTINATSIDPFIISITSLTAGNIAGLTPNFDSDANYSYTIATASGGITGFSTEAFSLNTDNFSNTSSGTWSIAQDSNNLNLVYSGSAVPEPSTYAALFGLAALGFAAYRRRQNHA